MTAAFNPKLVDELTGVVSQAASAILAVRKGVLNPRIKSDKSPVTAADEAAQNVILDGIARLLPGIPVISEEMIESTSFRTIGNAFILVDPLDGTRELLAGRDEFTVNVALVEAGVPVLGIVAAPALALIWRTAARGGAERLRLAPGAASGAALDRAAIRVRPRPNAGVIAVVSRSHLDPGTQAFLAGMPDVTQIDCGSAIKFCRVAEGAADIYPRLAPTHQWDVAAGHAVLTAAGGAVTTPERLPLRYLPAMDGLVVPGFIAWGDAAAASANR